MSKATDFSYNDVKLFERVNNNIMNTENSKKSPQKTEKIEENKNEESNNDINNNKEIEKSELKEKGVNIDDELINKDSIINKEMGKDSLMITELVDKIENKKEDNEKNILLEKKSQDLTSHITMQKGINVGMKSSVEDILEDSHISKININNNDTSLNEIVKKFKDIPKNSNKINSMLLLPGKQDIDSRENFKTINTLNKNKNDIKKNIIKLEKIQQLFENMSFPKENIVENNIHNYNLKKVKMNKEKLIKNLNRINEQIKYLVKVEEKKTTIKDKSKLDFSILDDHQEQYNKQLLKMEKKEKNIRMKFNYNIRLSYERRIKDIDNKEKQILEEKKKILKERKNKEKQLFLNRKKKMDAIMEKSKKYINEKSNKTENDYIFYKYKEKFENEQNKYLSKIKLIKKEPLVTIEEIKELTGRINERKKLLQMDNEEKKKGLKKIWSFRNQTLPTYRSPLLDVIENEKNLLKENKDLEQKKREQNDLEKKNYQPPKAIVSEKLKEQREKKMLMKSMDIIKETELKNKNRIKLKYMKLNPILPLPKKQLSQKNINNYIGINEFNNAVHKKNKKILNPIKLLRQKPEKVMDYFNEIYRNKTIKRTKKLLLSSKRNKDKNDLSSAQSMMALKGHIDFMNYKIKKKQELLNISKGYRNNPNLVKEVGNLLIHSVKTKLNYLSELYK